MYQQYQYRHQQYQYHQDHHHQYHQHPAARSRVRLTPPDESGRRRYRRSSGAKASSTCFKAIHKNIF